MMPYKAQVSNASRLGATRIAVPFERNRRVAIVKAFLHGSDFIHTYVGGIFKYF